MTNADYSGVPPVSPVAQKLAAQIWPTIVRIETVYKAGFIRLVKSKVGEVVLGLMWPRIIEATPKITEYSTDGMLTAVGSMTFSEAADLLANHMGQKNRSLDSSWLAARGNRDL